MDRVTRKILPSLDPATCLLAGGASPRVVPLGDQGDFRFTGVQPGDYALLVETPETAIVVEHIRLHYPHTGANSIDGGAGPYNEAGSSNGEVGPG